MYRSLAISCLFILASSSEFNVKECTKSGWMCQSCDTKVLCSDTDGKLSETEKIHCPPPTSCYQGTCTADLNPLCDYKDLAFPCQYQGLFPHPGDWTKYIFCEPIGTDPAGPRFTYHTLNCENGTGYNGIFYNCNRDLTKIPDTEFPIERCEKQNDQPIALPGNPTIHYVCAPYGPYNKLYPFQYSCASGGRFLKGECQPHLE